MSAKTSAESVVVETATLEEAVRIAAGKLRIEAERLETEVIGTTGRGLFGRAKPRLRVRVSLAAAAANTQPQPGRWMIAYADRALHIRLTPPQAGGEPVATGDIITVLHDLSMPESLDTWVTAQLARASEQPVAIPSEKLGDSGEPAITLHGSACVIVPPDLLSAWLISTSLDPGQAMRSADVLAALDRAGVTWGRQDALIARLDRLRLVHPLLVARGRAAQDGRDATIEYTFQQHAAGAKNPEDQKLPVDFREMPHATFVQAADVLARKIPAEPASEGMTVAGDALPAKDGVDLDLEPLAGKHTKLDEDGGVPNLLLRAELSGNARRNARKIEVDPLLVVSGDVGFKTGNIDFPGAVNVRGDVTSGFLLEAAGAVEIAGSVDGGTVIAEGDVTVRLGFLAEAEGHSGRIQSGGTVRLGFALGGTIHAREDVLVAREIMRSHIYAGGSVQVEGGGQIRGAEVVAGGDVRVGAIGGPMGTRTIVVAGCRTSLADIKHLLEIDLDSPNPEPVQPSSPQPAEASPPSDGDEHADAAAPDENPDTATDEPEPSGSEDQDEADQEEEAPEPPRPRVIASGYVEAGISIVVGRSILKPDQRIERCQFIEQDGAVVVLPL